MTKYLVSVNETTYYQQLEIEADSAEQAEEKYMDMLWNGQVLDVNQEYSEVDVKKMYRIKL